MWGTFSCKKHPHIVNFGQVAVDTMKSSGQENVKEAVQRALKESGVSTAIRVYAETNGRVLEIALPSVEETLLVEYHPGLAPYQVPSVLAHLRKRAKLGQSLGLCVRKLTWSLLDKCRESKVAVFDLEGNAYLRLPGVYIERLRPSQAREPAPSSGTVFTAKASRVVRAFLNHYPHDWGQAQLVRKTGLSAGYMSTLIKRLTGQSYVSDRLGLLYLDDPERLLNDWLAHYRFDRHRKLNYAISAGSYEEGVEKLGAALKGSGVAFAWTGWTGAHLRAPYATPTLYMAYVAQEPKKMKDVFPVEKQGNVALYVPQDEGVFQFTNESAAGAVVSDAQLYLDLCRMPGRAKEQAEAIRHARLDFARKTQ
jgi:hypothetical protein